MKINNILFVSPMFKEIQAITEKQGLQKSFRYLSETELTQTDIGWADALVCFNLQVNDDYSHVKWVHSLGAGVDRFLYKREWNEDVLLTRTICSFGQRIAEYSLSYILKDLQNHTEFLHLQQQKKWQPNTPKLLSEQKVMIYGTGEIGQTVAKIFSGLGIEVYGVSLSGDEKEYFKKVMPVISHFSKLPIMNYIINTLPLTDQTSNFFSDTIFGKLSDVGFINVGRGGSVNEQALLQALKTNHVRFAVLDVFDQEPLSRENPLWNHPNVRITPHISAVTTPNEGVACFIETLKNIEAKRSLANKVDVKKGY